MIIDIFLIGGDFDISSCLTKEEEDKKKIKGGIYRPNCELKFTLWLNNYKSVGCLRIL